MRIIHIASLGIFVWIHFVLGFANVCVYVCIYLIEFISHPLQKWA